jgi:phosphatidylethanolamine-binding protein (PEBP) family uncharacterized protein
VPTLLARLHLPRRYTCDGADRPLPVQWSDIPRGTAELALFIINYRPVHGSLFFDWAVAGIRPTSHGISAGGFQPGAVVGRNSFGKVGYSICPAQGKREIYAVKLLALPHPLAARPGFDAEALYQEAQQSAKFVGLAATYYKRP